MYYNTNNETGLDLRESWTSNAKQNELILRIFMLTPNNTFTPDEIQTACESYQRNWPITSIRRAISTLTDQAKLTKTNNLREGKHGKKTHIWKYNSIQHITQIRNDINDTDTPGQRINGF